MATPLRSQQPGRLQAIQRALDIHPQRQHRLVLHGGRVSNSGCMHDLVGPMLAVQRDPYSAPWFILFLAPLVWIGITGPSRGEWARGVGAWLVLYGQFFALIYNITHGESGIGCWSGWVY